MKSRVYFGLFLLCLGLALTMALCGIFGYALGVMNALSFL